MRVRPALQDDIGYLDNQRHTETYKRKSNKNKKRKGGCRRWLGDYVSRKGGVSRKTEQSS